MEVAGLPTGQSPAGTLLGPGLHRRVAAPRLTIRGLRPGLYKLVLTQVKITRSTGPLKRGAVAYPARSVSVRLRAGKIARIAGSYATIVNPGVARVSGTVLSLGGDPSQPASVVLGRRQVFAPGAVLSMAPSVQLPRGILERVQSVSHSAGRTTVRLKPVSVYEVVPVARFSIPLTADARTAHGADKKVATTDCGPNLASMSGVYRTITNPRFSGSWNTVSVFGAHVPVGANFALDFDVDAGIKDEAGAKIGLSCELDLPVSGMAGPIPVTGAVFGDVHASVGAGVGFTVDARLHVRAGANVAGLPPALVWVPLLNFSQPTVKVSALAEVAVTAGFGVGAKVGLGSDVISDATLNLNNDLDFTAQASAPEGSGCALKATFASFDAEGKLGAWTIESPSTPPLFTKTLWGPSSCEGQPSLVIRGSASFGGMANPGSFAQAMRLFGRPSSTRGDGSGVDCFANWQSLGIDALFQDFSAPASQPVCSPAADFNLSDVLVHSTRWATDRGVRVGDPLAKLRTAYPDAKNPADCSTDRIFSGERWRLLREPDPSAAGRYVCTLAAIVGGGKITGFELSNPAASE